MADLAPAPALVVDYAVTVFAKKLSSYLIYARQTGFEEDLLVAGIQAFTTDEDRPGGTFVLSDIMYDNRKLSVEVSYPPYALSLEETVNLGLKVRFVQ
jgi:hypothetical protein